MKNGGPGRYTDSPHRVGGFGVTASYNIIKVNTVGKIFIVMISLRQILKTK